MEPYAHSSDHLLAELERGSGRGQYDTSIATSETMA